MSETSDRPIQEVNGIGNISKTHLCNLWTIRCPKIVASTFSLSNVRILQNGGKNISFNIYYFPSITALIK